jgi:hypothetical protein
MHLLGRLQTTGTVIPGVHLRVHLNFNRGVWRSQGNDSKKAEASRERGLLSANPNRAEIQHHAAAIPGKAEIRLRPEARKHHELIELTL